MAKKEKTPKEPKQNKQSSGVSAKDSIRTKLIFVMAALVAIPMAVAIIVSAVNTMNEAKDNAVALNDLQVAKIESDINTMLEQNMNSIRVLADSPSTMEYLMKNGNDLSIGSELKEQVAEIDEMLGDGNTTVITGRDGMQLIRATGDLVDVSDREYFERR